MPSNDYTFTNMHCVDFKVFLKSKEHFAQFRFKNCSLAKKIGTIDKGSCSSIHFVTNSMNFTRLCMCHNQVRIKDFAKGGPASEVESCRHSKVELCEQTELFVTGV